MREKRKEKKTDKSDFASVHNDIFGCLVHYGRKKLLMGLFIKFAILFRNHYNKIKVLHLAGVFRAKSESDIKLVRLS